MATRMRQHAAAKSLVPQIKTIQTYLKDWLRMGKLVASEKNAYEQTRSRVDNSAQILLRIANANDDVIKYEMKSGRKKN